MRKLIVILLALALAAGVALAGRKFYRDWKTDRAVAKARLALANNDYENGLLWVRQAITLNARNVAAIRMMGDFAEMIGSPAAVGWRSRLLEVDPTPATNRFLLTRVAIAQREFVLALKTLDGVDAEGKKTGEYHRQFGALALATRSFQTAETHFEQAVKLEPANPFPAVQLGMLLLRHDEAAPADRGLRILEGLRTNPAVRVDALRYLAFDAFRHTNHARALQLAQELVAESNSVYSDRVMQLNLLVATASPQMNPTLVEYQQQAQTNAQHQFDLGRWMLGTLGPARALNWLETLPKARMTNLPVSMVVADAYAGQTNWSGLQRFVQAQRWGELEHLRLLYVARAFREQGLSTASKAEWSKAIREATGHLDRLDAIRGIALNWGWLPEYEETLWLIVTRFPAEKRSLIALSDRLFADGKTRSLLTLYELRSKLDPGDWAVKNNLATLALLLNSEDHRPHDLAREVYEQNKGNPIYAATYAFSLYLKKNNVESLKVMSQLRPEELQNPSVAGYYGLFLAAAGETSKAKQYLDLAAKAQVLPEEADLFRRANR